VKQGGNAGKKAAQRVNKVVSGVTARAETGETVAEQLSALERSLLDAAVRADREQVTDLLADDFVEFGSSGRVWTKGTTIAALADDDPGSSTTRTVADLRVRLLAEGAALVTYAVNRQSPGQAEVQTLRSSIWTREQGKWRMVFHQGTHRNGKVG
jgi:hypothetical protein